MKYFGGGGGGSGGVTSVFGRIGAVVAVLGDYTSSLVTNASGVAGATVTAALNTLDSALDSLQTQLDAFEPALLQGSDITGDVTLTVSGGTRYKIPPSSLSGNITIHLSVSGPPLDNETIVIDREDNSANTVTVINDGPLGGTLIVMPDSVEMGSGFSYAQGDWYPGGNYKNQ